jgi:hypothetical protein
MFAWARIVYDQGACALPGVSIRMKPFVAHMWEAVRLGFVRDTLTFRAFATSEKSKPTDTVF